MHHHARVRLADTIPLFIRVCRRGCGAGEVLERYVKPYTSVWKPYIEDHLDGSWSSLASRIALFASSHPTLPEAVAEAWKRLDTRKLASRLQELVGRLEELLGCSIGAVRVALVVTGLDSALSAYRDTVYIGVEWFAGPRPLGLEPGTPLYRVVERLAARPSEFIEANLLHELVHLATPVIRGPALLARLLEEGRATYLAWLASRGKTPVLPLPGHPELDKYEQCLPRLLKALRQHVRGETLLREEDLFQPGRLDPVCGLEFTGYYLGFHLARMLHHYYGTNTARLASLSSTRDIASIL